MIFALLANASVRAEEMRKDNMPRQENSSQQENLSQQDNASRKEITDELAQWTVAFNAGDAEKTCALFSRELRADYRGLPERGYDGQCDILKRSLADQSRCYSYALAINEVLVWGDVAVVRLTWTLTITPKDGKTITSIEPGLDVFRKEADGRWRIVRYMAFGQ
ncbi:MAG TPA: nuclear transport factor 2 family protein [Burkholderiales bacterium]|nr:nuclear transport factor 2 family protein [Burkholderiales bacterium]